MKLVGTKVYTPFPEYEESVPPSGATTHRSSYYLAGQLMAVRVRTGTSGNGALYFAFGDHLGNVSAWTNISGGLESGSLAHYDPYGVYRTKPSSTVNPDISDRGFTGHRHNNTGTNDLGLIYMNARYYLPEIGRFISADTIVPEPENPQSYNRYSYALNSPTNYTDPSGHCVTNDQEITRGDAFDCTVDEMAQLSWETRKWWLGLFTAESGVNWFNNILGIIDYFASDPQFSTLDGWASLSDAGVLIVIQDGWRQFNGEAAIENSPAAMQASGAWAEFFGLWQERGNESPQVASQWGVAEQAGVDFGVAIAEPLKATSDAATQIEIDTFVAFGNFYRWIISDNAALAVNFPIFNPQTQGSRDFVNVFSNYVVSPFASVLWSHYQAGQTHYGYYPH